MKKLITAVAIAASLISANANASDFAITLPIACKHVGKTDNEHYNEVNAGFGIEAYNIGVTYYNNSYSKPSVAMYYNFESPIIYNYFTVGIRAGGVTGYEQFTGFKVTPVAQPYFSANYDNHSLNLGVLPTGIAADSTVKAVITLDYQYNF